MNKNIEMKIDKQNKLLFGKDVLQLGPRIWIYIQEQILRQKIYDDHN